MTVVLCIPDGPNVWDSPSIVASSNRPTSTADTPGPTNIYSTSDNVDVYVNVENNGTDDVGCPVGAWANPLASPFVFTQRLASGGSRTDPHNGWTFSATPGLDSLDKSGVGSFSFPNPTSGRKCWGWSPDSRFFGFVSEPLPGTGESLDGRRWRLQVVALDGATKFDGTQATIAVPDIVIDFIASGSDRMFAIPFEVSFFGWIGSSGLLVSGLNGDSSQLVRFIACFRMTTPGVAHDSAAPASQWDYRASPCGSQVAFLEHFSAAGNNEISWHPTTALSPAQPRVNGTAVTLPFETTGGSPTIETLAHSRLGVNLFTGSGLPAKIDDPDDTESFTSTMVHVDRVNVSTLATANQFIKEIGTAAASTIPHSQSRWVEVPNLFSWDRTNQAGVAEQHWCLLAQTYDDRNGLPKIWNGQAASPTVFPAQTEDRCSQRNVDIY